MLPKNSKTKLPVFNLKPPTSFCQRKAFSSHWRERARDAAIANKNKRLAFYGTDQRGASTVEFAIIVVLFFVLIMGFIDFGRAVWTYHTLSHATREGARYAIVHGSKSNNPATFNDIRDIVRSHANYQNITVTTCWPDGDVPCVSGANESDGNNNNQGDRVEIVAEYNFQPVTSIIAIPTIKLKATSEMTISY